MAAGLGFKDFTTGEVLTAADVDGYLMQGIWVFATTTARDAAVTAPAEGNFAFTKDTNSLWYYDGAAWVASGATGDIEGVTAGVGISGGGTSGTVTVTNSMATAITTKGDLVVGTGSGTFVRQGVGTDGQVLTADSTQADGVLWTTPTAGMTNPMTTTGDTIYSSSGSTPARRAIGTTGQVLTVSGGLPTWATPSSGSMTAIASGTMSGSSVTLSSIDQTYNNLRLVIRDVYGSSTINNIFIRFNGNTSSVYQYNKQLIGTAAWTTQAKSGTPYITDTINDSASNGSQIFINVNDYAAATCHTVDTGCILNNTSTGTFTGQFTNLVCSERLAISSISIHADVNTFSGGTYILYGVK